jgi:peptidoglycan/xylan/chitin deacetylase (PgdA/CDA1 family)
MTLAFAVACDSAAGVASPTVTVSPVVPAPTATTPAVTTTPTPAETAVATVAATLAATPISTATQAPTAASTVASTEPARVLQLGRTDEKVVTLTFDAGADAGFTEEILDTLAANGVRGGFGITGRWAEQNPELVKRIATAGHELINHTYNHSSFTGMSTSAAPQSQAARWDQLDRTEGIIDGLTGATTTHTLDLHMGTMMLQ